MLELQDILLGFTHISLVVFNLFGWIPKMTRKANFITLMITAGSWFVLGIWFGIGYCPITDWQWRVKRALGERNLPGSFIKYFADKLTGYNFPASTINAITVACFFIAIFASLYVNFIRKAKPVNRKINAEANRNAAADGE